jgi:putative endonuclease
MEKQYYIYIMTNNSNTVTYTGVTNDLFRRISEHKAKSVPGFTKRYNINKLVYYEAADNAASVIWREKQIKNFIREKKVALINSLNPGWIDLYNELLKE